MHLNIHSYYSLRYGTLSPERIIELALKNNVKAMALTDINNSSGTLEFVKLCWKNNIKPIAGMEYRNENKHLFTGIAKNNEGFRELNEKLSHHNISKTKIPDTADEFKNAFIIYPFGSKSLHQLEENEYIGIRPEETGKLITSEYRKDKSKLVVMQPVSFADNEGYLLHKHLRAIDNNILISQLRPEQLAQPFETMISTDKLRDHYSYYPQIIKNTEHIIEECGFDFDYKSHKNRKAFTGSVSDDVKLLRWIAKDGFEYRYKKTNIKALQRLHKELDIIVQLGFTAYFLITWDVIRFSMSKGFYHVGRGSGANSVVAFCLKITDVDPIELDLYFERFLNPKRTSPPDFDIDYSWRDRDTVQEYVFSRFGNGHTALLGTMSTFKGKSIYRELGKVYGLPKEEIDSLISRPDEEINKNTITQKIHIIHEMMVDFPNLRSIHAGGILISDAPINYYTALDMPPKGFQTTQWDMYMAEEIGFEKLDILSQRGIGHINECVEIVRYNRGTDIDVHQVEKFKTDKQVQEKLKSGECTGCFYIESPAMRGLLKKLRCSDYLTLVAASSIIRPGVARSGMMKEYIKRFHNPANFEYLHPIMEEQLKETFGVMVYQEDVLKICHHFGGLDLADADVLRRIMSGKPRGNKKFDLIVGRFISNCRERGYPDDVSKEVLRQIVSFAGYSFSKAHSASYAVESFQSLYLKTYFPLEFMVAVINNFGGYYRTWVYFNEAKRLGANIKLPCVNNSQYMTSIKDRDIYVGFVHVANLERKVAYTICSERAENDVYTSLEDFLHRVRIGIEQLIILIRLNAFAFTRKAKAELLWNAHFHFGKSKVTKPAPSLFAMPANKFTLPTLEYNCIEDAYDELELLEFTVSISHFEMLKTKFRGERTATELEKNIGKTLRMLGQLVTIKYVRTIRKQLMHFGTFIDVEGNFFDTVHFPDSLKHSPFRGDGIYLILGKVVEEFEFPSIEVTRMAKLPIKPDPRT